MNLFALVIVGFIAGFLASKVMPSKLGTLGDTIVGIIGALIGGVIFNTLGGSGADGLNIWSILVAFVGAIVLLLLIGVFNGRRALSR